MYLKSSTTVRFRLHPNGQHVHGGKSGVPLCRLVHQDNAGVVVRRHHLPLLDMLGDGAALVQHHLVTHIGLN